MNIAFLLLAIGFRSFVAEPFRIPSGSMAPTLEVGSHIIVSKLGYGNYDFFNIEIMTTKNIRSINRGDVMVFKHPRHSELDYVKRVIGLPGENIRYKSKRLFIDNIEILRVQQTTPPTASNRTNISRHLEFVDEKSYEVLIDESRHTKLDIDITVPEGHYFMLGDNRDNSNDSRYWGFVPEENIVGKLVYILR